jgi:4-hydroxythreonine-4-phosphate dehydrogenase
MDPINYKKKIAISVGDLNGIGIELILKSHKRISKLCIPIYCINKTMLLQAAQKLNIKIPSSFKTYNTKGTFNIKASQISSKSGRYSYDSFIDAIKLTESKKTKAVVTLPINKESWNKAGIKQKGHTELLKNYFNKNAIMLIGCSKMFVALYTQHIPLKDISKEIKIAKLTNFLIDFYNCTPLTRHVAVLGLNPHASDNGILGNEEIKIKKAIENANEIIYKKSARKDYFQGPKVPDTIFAKFNREKYKYFIAMYHDQGLAPLKSLYFEKSINISLNLPIIRTSVDHGTAFDLAYKNRKTKKLNDKSYINAVKEAIKLINK